jgi:PKD repeat protein
MVTWSSNLKGVCIEWNKLGSSAWAPYPGPNDSSVGLARVASTGFNIIRVSVDWQGAPSGSFPNNGSPTDPANYASNLAVFANAADAAGVYCYYGLGNSHNENEVTSTNGNWSNLWTTTWLPVLQQCGNHSSTIGYKLLNEPGGWSLSDLQGYYAYIYNQIRTYETNNGQSHKTIILQGNGGAQEGYGTITVSQLQSAMAALIPSGATNLIFGFHNYNQNGIMPSLVPVWKQASANLGLPGYIMDEWAYKPASDKTLWTDQQVSASISNCETAFDQNNCPNVYYEWVQTKSSTDTGNTDALKMMTSTGAFQHFVSYLERGTTVVGGLVASAGASPISGSTPLAVAFTGSASGGTGPYTYAWDFGNGDISTSQNPSETFINTGTSDAIYTVKLTVTDSASHTSSDTVQITVKPTVVTTPFVVEGFVSANGSGGAGSTSWSIDGSAHKADTTGTATSLTQSLTTSDTNDLIFACLALGTAQTSAPTISGGGLTWTLQYHSSSDYKLCVWSAPAASALASASITVTIGIASNLNLHLFGLNGAGASPALDGSPVSASGTGTAPSVNITTTNANDIVLGFFQTNGGPTVTLAANWTAVDTTYGGNPTNVDIYQTFTSTQTGLAVGITLSASKSWLACAIAVKGGGGGGNTSVSATITTTNGSSSLPEMIVAAVAVMDTTSTATISDTSGSTTNWTQRIVKTGTGEQMMYFYSLASAPLTNDLITVTLNSGTLLYLVCFGIYGENGQNLFDPGAVLPVVSSGTSTTASATVSTTNPTDLVLAFILNPGAPGGTTITTPSGFTKINISTSPALGAFYNVMTSVLSSSSISSTLGTSENWVMIVDAIQQSGTGVVSPCPGLDVQANQDGSCPPGYQPDPAAPGCCKPIPPSPLPPPVGGSSFEPIEPFTIVEMGIAPPTAPISLTTSCPKGDVPANPDGSCPQGYQPDPSSPGCCKPATQPQSNPNVPTATAPQGWTFIFEDWNTTKSILTGKTSSFTQILPTMYTVAGPTPTLSDNGYSGFTSNYISTQLVSLGFKVQASCQAGAGNPPGTDDGIIAIITDTPAGTQQAFINQMIAACQANGMVGFNLDWEPGGQIQPSGSASPYTNAMTSFIQNASTQMHNAGFILTLEVASWYSIGAYGGDNQNAWLNLGDLAATPIDFLCDMDYRCNLSDFNTELNFMLSKIPPAKLAIILISYNDTSTNCSVGGTNPYAQLAVEAVQNNNVGYNIPCLAIWPSNYWTANSISPSTSTWFSLFASFQAKTFPPV